MKVYEQAWVTVVLDDDSVLEPLILAESLRRCMTSRKILVFVGPAVSKRVRHNLEQVFDVVVKVTRRGRSSREEVKAAAKHLTLSLPLPYRKCVFLDPKLLVIQNCDELFEAGGVGSLTVTEGRGERHGYDSSVLLVEPGLDNFEALEELLLNQEPANSGESCIERWLSTQDGFVELGNEYGYPFGMVEGGLKPSVLELPKIVQFGDKYPVGLVQNGESLPRAQFEQQVLEYWEELCTVVQARFCPNGNITASRGAHTEPIAIVGMACRFPGANDLEEFWEILRKGEDQMRPIPSDRWTGRDGVASTPDERSIPAGFLKCAVDEFDGNFFGMSPLELSYLDPQQRLALEVTWEALEDGGIDPDSLKGTHTGIFTGTWKNDYHELMTVTGYRHKEFYRSYMGNAFGATSGRLAFMLGVTGPNIASESGCSSSMVSLGLACKSLRNQETNLSLVCGMNLLLHPFSFESMKPVLALDGRCKTFDESADGYARAEGIAVVVLKRVSDAVRDGDRIYSLIRGYGEAQEGPSKSMGTPTVECEALAINLALEDAGVEPGDVEYVEAHGTGTEVGDPTEMEAIARAYSRGRKQPLVVGSVKTVTGHSESCSGLTGLMKTVLALEKEEIPPHINLQKLNPRINLDKIPAEIPVEGRPWKKYAAPETRRRTAGVSSHGITGTDTHLIVEEAPSPHTAPKFVLPLKRSREILTLSAKSADALDDMVQNYIHFFKQNPTVELSNVCFTANTGRAHLGHRVAVVGESVEDIVKKLEKKSYLQSPTVTGGSGPKVGFLFTGHGSHYHGMGQGLYETNPVFRHHFDTCNAIFKSECGLDVRKFMWGSDPNPQLSHTTNSQPAIFTVEYALLKMWESWGVRPDLVLGHSLGEVCSALAAGAWSVDQAARFVVGRAKAFGLAAEGRMLAVKAGQGQVVDMIERVGEEAGPDFWIDVATINSRDQTVVSGRETSVRALASYCRRRDIKTHMVDAAHGFHSRDMDVSLPKLRHALDTIYGTSGENGHTPKCAYISGVYGRALDSDEQIGTKYWLDNTRDSVRFVEASQAAYGTGCRHFLEIGSQPVLSALLKANTDGQDAAEAVSCFPSMRKKEEEWTTALTTLGALYVAGVDIDWKEFHKFYPGRKIRLPYYPFQRRRHWFEPPRLRAGGGPAEKTLHPHLGSLFPTPTPTKIYHNVIHLEHSQYLGDHVLGSHVIFPAACWLEMCLSAGQASTLASFEDFYAPVAPIVVEQMGISAPMEVKDGGHGCQVQTIISPVLSSDASSDPGEGGVGWSNVEIYSQHGEDMGARKWVIHATAKFSSVVLDNLNPNLGGGFGGENLVTIQRRMSTSTVQSTDKFYDMLGLMGLNFGPVFKSLQRYQSSEDGEFLVEVKVPDAKDEGFLTHPVALDAMVQALMLDTTSTSDTRLLIPVSIGKFVWLAKGTGSQNHIHVFKETTGEGGKVAVLFDDNGTKLGVMSRVQFIRADLLSITKSLEKQKLNLPALFEENWRTTPALSPTFCETQTNPTWLIFSGENSLGDNVTRKLKQCDRSVLVARPGQNYSDLGNGILTLNPREKEDVRRALLAHDGLGGGGGLEGIIYLWGLDPEKVSQTDFTQGFLHLEQVVLELHTTPLPKLVVVTTGAISVGDDDDAKLPHAGTLWGMSKTLRSEHPNLRCKCVDVDVDVTSEMVDALFNELWTEDKEFQVAYRSRDRIVRYVARLTSVTLTPNPLSFPSNTDRFALVLPKTKAIGDLKFGPVPKEQLSLTENFVEVRVKAAGLNFKDVLSVLQPDAQFETSSSVGADYSGVVVRAGPAVTKFQVGDAVLGCNWEGQALPSHVSTREESIVALPKDWTFADGATLATAFATAFYSLVRVAGLRKGETVLIHTASGAVGICAIQIARGIGAQIIATAGSKRKRAFLSNTMRVEHIFDSRTSSYGKQIEQVTAGRGVDMVLNSLTSPGFKEASLAACSRNARFVEMSRLNIWQPDEVFLLRPDVKYTTVELSESSVELWNDLFLNLHNFLAEGKLEPIPHTRFDAAHVRDALTYLQRAKHVGKVVCVMPDTVEVTSERGGTAVRTVQNNLFSDRASYLITGGLGGIGLELAKWMTDLGAKYVVLCGRREPGVKARETIDRLRTAGKEVVVILADVGKRVECQRLLQQLRDPALSLPPLRGIMHAAGCLSDGLVVDQTWSKFEETFNGKVSGGWLLHELTLSYNLEHFVVYSSIVGILGAMGQSNHASGNTFLDSLVHHRHSLGLSATSINWGQWGQVGIAAELEIAGLSPFTPGQALATLELVMKSHRLQTAIVNGDVAVWKLLFAWAEKYLEEVKVHNTRSNRKKGVGGGEVSSDVTSASFWEALDKTRGSPGERSRVVEKLVISVLHCILKLDEGEEIDVHKEFQDLGLDSLMLVELRNILQTLLGPRINLSLGTITDHNTVALLIPVLTELISREDAAQATVES